MALRRGDLRVVDENAIVRLPRQSLPCAHRDGRAEPKQGQNTSKAASLTLILTCYVYRADIQGSHYRQGCR